MTASPAEQSAETPTNNNVPATTIAATTPATSTPVSAQNTTPATTQTATTPATPVPGSIEASLLADQPPGTIIKCVTAQVIQTTQGPRIVLQGLQGADFTPQQLSMVQQQVKQQLLKGTFLFVYKALLNVNIKTLNFYFFLIFVFQRKQRLENKAFLGPRRFTWLFSQRPELKFKHPSQHKLHLLKLQRQIRIQSLRRNLRLPKKFRLQYLVCLLEM